MLSGCGGAFDVPEFAPSSVQPGAVGGTLPATTRPGPLKGHVVAADVILWRSQGLSRSLQNRLRRVPGVRATERFSLARVSAQEQQVLYAAVDPATFRRFTVGSTARFQPVWDKVADGLVALRADLRAALATTSDQLPIGSDGTGGAVPIGAYASLVPGSDIGAVVNTAWGARLGMPAGNAMLVSIAPGSLDAATRELTALVGRDGAVQGLHGTGAGQGMATLAGGSIAQAVGSFTYFPNADGTVRPDPRWVAGYIRTESVPLLGAVRCNKAMLPQLRAALQEIVTSGLAASIHPSEYGGCYVPRFIANDPARGLSLHTWGLAVDLNVPGNQRGTVGTMDPEVVRIFNRWGFAWGGVWQDPDPMHFELARLLSVAR